MSTGIARLEELVKKFPEVADYSAAVARSLHGLAVQLRKSGESVKARALLERAIHYQKAALKIAPQDANYHQDLREHYWVLADTLLSLKDHREAARVVAELTKILPDGWVGHRSGSIGR